MAEYLGRYTYLFLDILSLIFPLLLSFDKKVHFYTRWKQLFPGILAGLLVFVIWDVWFTRAGIWSFNPDYVMGIYWFHLPVEEWLFFICVPYSCVFIYECLKVYFKDYLSKISAVLMVVLLITSIVLAVLYIHQLYTVITFSALMVMLIIHYLLFKNKYFGYFFWMWIIHLIPLFLVNGQLTSIPVVSYNDQQNMGLRIGTVPFEDSFYSMVLLLINVSVYELLGKWKKTKTT